MHFQKSIITTLFLFAFSIVFAQTTWTLDDCLSYLEKNSSELLAEKLNPEIAAQNTKIQKSDLLLSASANISHGYDFGSTINPSTNGRQSLNIQSDNFYVSADWTLFNFSTYKSIQSLKHKENQARYDYESVVYNAKVNLIQLFYQYLFDKENAELSQKQLENAKFQLDWVKNEVEIGSKAKSDEYDISLNYQQKELELMQNKNSAQTSKLNLLSALEIHQDSIEFKPNPKMELVNYSDQNIEKIINNRPEFLSYKSQKNSLQANLKQYKNGFLPTLGLNYSWNTFYSKELGESVISFADQFKDNKGQYVGLSLYFPFFNGFLNKRKSENVKIQLTQLDQQTHRQKNKLTEQWLLLKNNLQQSESVYGKMEQMKPLQQKTFEKSVERFKAGLINNYGYISAKEVYENYESQLLQQKYTLKLRSRLTRYFLE